MRVLIVDDHYSVRRGVRALLLLSVGDIEICGEAENGRDAVVQAGKLQPDVIIMDIRMPILDGFEATRQIRHSYPSIAVILLTLHDSSQARKEAFNVGAFDYVEKPAIWTKLLPALRRLNYRDQVSTSRTQTQHQVRQAETRRSQVTPQLALRDAEQRFLSTFEHTAIAMAHVAENGRWLRVNQKLCEILGFSKNELQQLTFQDITHPSDLDLALTHATKVASGELNRYAIHKRYIRKDGQIVPIRLNADAVRDSEGNLRYYSCVIEDATVDAENAAALQQTRRALQIANDHLELISRQTNAPLTRCSRDLRYLWVNSQYANLLNRRVEHIVGRRILDIVGKEAFQTLEPHFAKVLNGNEVAYKDLVAYESIGKRFISAAYHPTLDSDGKPDGWVAFVQDITDQRETQPPTP